MLNIKEIALKVGLQAFEEHPYDKGHVVSPSGYTWIDDKLIEFAEALIAEIAKQNKPVVSQYKGSDGSWKSFDSKDHESNTRNSGEWEVRDLFTFPPTAEQIANERYPDKTRSLQYLFTSDQVAAAILKATKPLEDSLAVVKKDRADLYMETLTLRDKLAKAEQRVAEACALTYLEDYDLTDIAERIRSGEWRKFVKEV